MNDRRHEDGGIAVVVAIFMAFVVLAIAAATIDLGSLWQSQRNLVTNTDAMALGGARLLAAELLDTGTCPPDTLIEGEVEALRQLNNIDDEIEDITIACDGTQSFRGLVRVDAQQPSDSVFSDGDLSAPGTTTAAFELLPHEAEGLAICQNWFPDGDGTTAGTRITVAYGHAKQAMDDLGVPGCPVDSPPAGPSAPTTAGSWGWIDGLCTTDLEATDNWCDGDVGTAPFGGWAEVGRQVVFPLYSEARGQGSGPVQGSEFNISGFGSATIVGWSGSGGPPNPYRDYACPPYGSDNCPNTNQPRWITFDIDSIAFFNNPSVGLFGDVALSICDVDGSGALCPSDE